MTDTPRDEPLDPHTAILRTFEGMGGLKKMVTWAKTHQREFYSQIFTKLLPLTQVNTQVNVNVKDDADEARAKLKDMIMRIIDAQEADEAMGIFRDEQGVIITNPERIRLEQQIYDLKKKRADAAAAGIIDVAPNLIDATPPPAPPEPSTPKLVYDAANPKPKPKQLTPEQKQTIENDKLFKRELTPAEARDRSYRPPPTLAPDAAPSSTDLYLRWVNGGGGTGLQTDWGPGSHWSRLP